MKKVLRIICNKFVITTIAFAAWMIFFDQNDIFSQRERKKELETTENNIAFLNKEIATMQAEHDAMNNPQKLEKFARENYRMKRDNEDLYVIEKNK